MRMPAVRWRGMLALVASVALGSLIGVSLSGTTLDTTPTAVAAIPKSIPKSPCDGEVWPYFSKECLQQPDQDATKPRAGVRVISLDRDAPSTVFIYPEAPKTSAAKSKRPAVSSEAKTDGRNQRTAKRRAASQRDAAWAYDPYRAYGYSRRGRPRR